MRDWFLANLFIAAIVLLAAGYIFVAGWIYHRLDEHGVNAWLGLTCATLALVGTYYAARGLHRLVNRWVNRGSRAPR